MQLGEIQYVYLVEQITELGTQLIMCTESNGQLQFYKNIINIIEGELSEQTKDVKPAD